MGQDLVHAVRHAIRHKLVSAATLLSLALSIGIVTAVFSLVRQVLLEPLPYQEPHRLAALWTVEQIGTTAEPMLSPPDLLEVERETQVFEDLAGAVGFTASLAGAEADAEEVRTAMVTWNFFPLLGIDPVLGRHFLREEQAGENRRALITHDLWQGRYGGNPQILGRTIDVNGSAIEVVGVLPADWVFYAPEGSGASISASRDLRVWEVFRFDIDNFPRTGRFFTTVARLRDGVTWPEVESEMERHTGRLQQLVPEYGDRGTAITATPLRAGVLGGSGRALWVLSIASALVLLIASVNLLALSRARLAARAQEFNVRAALGAERHRLLRQRLMESATVAVAGGVLGAGLAQVMIEVVRRVRPRGGPAPRNRRCRPAGTPLCPRSRDGPGPRLRDGLGDWRVCRSDWRVGGEGYRWAREDAWHRDHRPGGGLPCPVGRNRASRPDPFMGS